MPCARSLDQFFTRRDVAEKCAALVREQARKQGGNWLWIEPSAGEGAFLDTLAYPRIGLDISPRRGDISRIDFLSWAPGNTPYRLAVVGNPPFGKNASLARKFFNHAAGFADLIAFILPRTFQKEAFVDGLHPSMHLLEETVLDLDSFEFEGQPYCVPTVFQVWERRPWDRPRGRVERKHEHFSFVASSHADFAFQRVGARAGLVSYRGLGMSPQSHYFLKSHIDAGQLYDRLATIDWEPIKRRTAGNPSIGKGELVATYVAMHG
jgi:hypothetical protein